MQKLMDQRFRLDPGNPSEAVSSTEVQVTFLPASPATDWSSAAVVLRSDCEHDVSALSTAVCQAGTEETILDNSPKYSSASMGAIRESLGGRTDLNDTRTSGTCAEDRDHHHRYNRSMWRWTRFPVAELVQNQARRLFALPCHQRKAIRRRSGRAG